MRYLTFIILLASVCSAQQSVTPSYNLFNGGKISSKYEGNIEQKKYMSGQRQSENMIQLTEGPITKRPGLTLGALWNPNAGAYPKLHELDASEYPAKPTVPSLTVAAPTTIANASEFVTKITADPNANFILTGDCDFTALSPYTAAVISTFSGKLDGDGYTISNLTINVTHDASTAGLFGTLTGDASVKDLTIQDFTITATGDSDNIAGFAGKLYQASGAPTGTNIFENITMENIDVSGSPDSVALSLAHYAGFIGHIDILNEDHYVAINLCDANEVDVYMAAGYTDGAEISYMGPWFGLIEIDGSITLQPEIVIVDSTTKDCYIFGVDELGGFCGDVYHSVNITNYDDNVVFWGCTVTNPEIICTDYSESCVGGFLGAAYGVTSVKCDVVGGSITIDELIDVFTFIGGFVGWDLSYCRHYSNDTSCSILIDFPSLLFNGGEIGGYVGLSSGDATYLRCSATGDITISTHPNSVLDSIGGFVGSADPGPNSELQIQRCWTETDVTMTNATYPHQMGGFVGWLDGSSTSDILIQDCYTWGDIISLSGQWNTGKSVGGFLGQSDLVSPGAVIDNAYCAQTDVRTGSGYTDRITWDPDAYVGGFAGREDVTDSIQATTTNCFYDYDTCGFINDYSTAQAYPTCEMFTQQNYVDAGWSFSPVDQVKSSISDIWYSPRGAPCNNGTPPAARLIPFTFSTDDAVVLAFDRNSIGFVATINGVTGRVQE
jgi:hypothetical protein